MNPDDNTPQKPVTPPTGGTEEPRPTPWVPSGESDGTNAGINPVDSTTDAPVSDSGLGDAAGNPGAYAAPDTTPEGGPGMPETPTPPTFDTAAGMPPMDPTPPPAPGVGDPLSPQPPLPPTPDQPGMPGGAPQFGAPVQPGVADGNTPLVPLPPEGPQAGVGHTSPALMIGLLAFGVLLIIGFIIYLFVRK